MNTPTKTDLKKVVYSIKGIKPLKSEIVGTAIAYSIAQLNQSIETSCESDFTEIDTFIAFSIKNN